MEVRRRVKDKKMILQRKHDICNLHRKVMDAAGQCRHKKTGYLTEKLSIGIGTKTGC